MAVHTTDQKLFIVRHLARCYSRPEIVAAFARQYPDTRCDVEDVKAVDPAHGLTDGMLLAVYKAVQAEFLAEPPPISRRGYRLAMMQRIFDGLYERGAHGAALSVLAQAAAEMGGTDSEPGGGARRITEIVETIIDPVAA